MSKSSFWNSVRKALTINPKVSSGMPVAKEFRFVAPGGQPPAFVPLDPLADDIAQNPYYGRDFRRNYPRLAVYTQGEVAGLIAAKESLAIGSGESAIAKTGEDLSLTEVIKSAKTPLYTAANLPPVPTVRNFKWAKSPDQPPVPNAVALLVSTTAAPSASHLLSDQDLNGLAPLDPSPLPAPVAPASTQVIPQQDIQVGSETDVYPVTGVYPSLIYRPAIQLYDPLVNNFQSYGAYNPLDDNSDYGYGDYPDDGSSYLDNGPAGIINKRQVPTGPSGQSGGVVGAPSDISTNTVIQPIVRIQPHALQPVPVPVSQPYTVPVPVGVSVPWQKRCFPGPCDDCTGRFDWGDDCDWGRNCDWRDCGWRDNCSWRDNCDCDCDCDCDW
ncbi:hypothetical protein BGX26_008992 [Mortierella sp. AD094]|nr:hypothetical protein BGX26_008992 [Mortierella sp. AD094]